MTDLPEVDTLAKYFDRPKRMKEDDQFLLIDTLLDYYSRPSQDHTCRFCGYKMLLRKGYTTACVGCATKNIKTSIEWL